MTVIDYCIHRVGRGDLGSMIGLGWLVLCAIGPVFLSSVRCRKIAVAAVAGALALSIVVSTALWAASTLEFVLIETNADARYLVAQPWMGEELAPGMEWLLWGAWAGDACCLWLIVAMLRHVLTRDQVRNPETAEGIA
jgi:hypothetical protein